MTDNGTLQPIKIILPGMLFSYSKNKGGVDGSSKYRAIFRSSTTTITWEKRFVKQTINNLLIKVFVDWSFVHLHRPEGDTMFTFSLDVLRRKLNRVESFGDFVSKLSEGIMDYGTSLMGAVRINLKSKNVQITAYLEVRITAKSRGLWVWCL